MVIINKFGHKLTIHKDGKIFRKEKQMLDHHINLGGYKRICVQDKASKKTKMLFVHQLVLEAFVGPKPNGLWVNHKDGDKTNNHIDNLEYCTPSYNNWHRYHVLNKHGAIVKGRGHQSAKYSCDSIKHAMLLKGKTSTRKASKITGISKSHIHCLWSNKTHTEDVMQNISKSI